MAIDPRLPALIRVASLIKDMRLADLHRAEAAKAALQDRLAVLAEPVPCPDDLPPSIAADVSMRYHRWADQRRREIETALQHQAQICDAAKTAARLAFGRDMALSKLTKGPRPGDEG